VPGAPACVCLTAHRPHGSRPKACALMTGRAATRIVTHPWAFGMQTVKAFGANQGLLLAGHAVADRRGLRLADHRHRRAAQPGAGRNPVAARRPGDRRVRAHRQRVARSASAIADDRAALTLAPGRGFRQVVLAQHHRLDRAGGHPAHDGGVDFAAIGRSRLRATAQTRADRGRTIVASLQFKDSP